VWDPYSTNWFLRTHARLDEAAVLAGLPCALLLWSAVPGRSQVHRRPRAAVDKRGGCAMVAGGFVVYAVVCCMWDQLSACSVGLVDFYLATFGNQRITGRSLFQTLPIRGLVLSRGMCGSTPLAGGSQLQYKTLLPLSHKVGSFGCWTPELNRRKR
jgi:hypothetical protein